jgi:hypothetical protein
LKNNKNYSTCALRVVKIFIVANIYLNIIIVNTIGKSNFISKDLELFSLERQYLKYAYSSPGLENRGKSTDFSLRLSVFSPLDYRNLKCPK